MSLSLYPCAQDSLREFCLQSLNEAKGGENFHHQIDFDFNQNSTAVNSPTDMDESSLDEVQSSISATSEERVTTELKPASKGTKKTKKSKKNIDKKDDNSREDNNETDEEEELGYFFPDLSLSKLGACTKDAKVKPMLSYIALISMAIQSNDKKRMLLSEIYNWITENFPYYRVKDKSWRNSIRHNLSLNECFIKNGRSENGKGNYWTIHPANVDDFAQGDFRRRRARRRVRKSNEELERSNDCTFSSKNLTEFQSAGDMWVPMTMSRAPVSSLISIFGARNILSKTELDSWSNNVYPEVNRHPQAYYRDSETKPSTTLHYGGSHAYQGVTTLNQYSNQVAPQSSAYSNSMVNYHSYNY